MQRMLRGDMIFDNLSLCSCTQHGYLPCWLKNSRGCSLGKKLLKILVMTWGLWCLAPSYLDIMKGYRGQECVPIASNKETSFHLYLEKVIGSFIGSFFFTFWKKLIWFNYRHKTSEWVGIRNIVFLNTGIMKITYAFLSNVWCVVFFMF